MSSPISPDSEPELLPDVSSRSEGRSRGWLWGTAAVAGVAVAGGAAWGLTSFLDSGPAASVALPADTYAYVALDMDPSGGQKVEAWQTLRKFPALREELGLESGDDIRRWVYEAAVDNLDCDVPFADVEDWLGSKAALAAVPGEDGVVGVGVVEVSDEEAARAGAARLAGCGGAEAPGTAFVGDFMIVAEDLRTAASVAKSVADGSLADDETHQRWTDAVGDAGVVAAYVAPTAPAALIEEMSQGMGMPSTYAGRAAALVSDPATPSPSMPADLVERLDELPEPPEHFQDLEEFGDGPGMPLLPGPGMFGGGMLGMMPFSDDVEDAFEDFEGMAMAIRFADGSLEAEVVSALPDEAQLPAGDSGIGDLPASTAVALGMPTGAGWVDQILASIEASVGEDEYARGVRELERELGVSVPEDLRALAGEGVAVAVDSSIDLSELFSLSATPEGLPLGVRITGDPDTIRPVLERVLEAAGVLADVEIAEGDGAVAVGSDAAFVQQLAAGGDLGDSDTFDRALSDSGSSTGAMFVDFDADDWLTKLMGPGDAEAEENLEPLDALGVSGRVEDGVMRVVARLTTD